MNVDEILISAQPGETRVASRHDSRTVELLVFRDSRKSVAGNIYLGRAGKVLKGLQAAFIDIGLEQDGFLALPEARPPELEGGNDHIGKWVCEGDAVLVQALCDPQESKGAKLTTHITLPGHNVVLLPGIKGFKISRRITGADRERMEKWAKDFQGGGEGLLIRTGAAAAKPGAIKAEIEALGALWDGVKAARDKAAPPICLHAGLDPIFQTLKDWAGPALRRVAVDDTRLLKSLQAWRRTNLPETELLLEPHRGCKPLFEAEGVEEELEAALLPHVALPCGGGLVIEETAAVVAIDVNSGGGACGDKEDTALAINLEAAAEAARQIRLRNLSGLLVIDFLRLRRRNNRQRVLDVLNGAFRDDLALTHVAGFTSMGLVELTRRRRAEPLSRVLGATCSHCAGSGLAPAPETLARQAIRRTLAEAESNPGATLTLHATAAITEALEGSVRKTREAAEARLGQPLDLKSTDSAPPEGFEITAKWGD